MEWCGVMIDTIGLLNILPPWLEGEDRKNIVREFESLFGEPNDPDVLVSKIIARLAIALGNPEKEKRVLSEFQRIEINTFFLNQSFSEEKDLVLKEEFYTILSEKINKAKKNSGLSERLFQDPVFLKLLQEFVDQRIRDDFLGRNDNP